MEQHINGVSELNLDCRWHKNNIICNIDFDVLVEADSIL